MTAQPRNQGSAKTDAEVRSDVVREFVRLGGEVVEVTMVYGGEEDGGAVAVMMVANGGVRDWFCFPLLLFFFWVLFL